MKIVMDEFRWNVADGPEQTRVLMMQDASGVEVHVLLSADDAAKIGDRLKGAPAPRITPVGAGAKPLKGIVGT